MTSRSIVLPLAPGWAVAAPNTGPGFVSTPFRRAPARCFVFKTPASYVCKLSRGQEMLCNDMLLSSYKREPHRRVHGSLAWPLPNIAGSQRFRRRRQRAGRTFCRHLATPRCLTTSTNAAERSPAQRHFVSACIRRRASSLACRSRKSSTSMQAACGFQRSRKLPASTSKSDCRPPKHSR